MRFPEAVPEEASESAVAAAVWAAPCLFPALAPESVRRVAREALTFPTPLVEVLPGLHVLELFHGPTHAFKDVGARFMAALMRELDEGETGRTILVATSGDTGGAVAAAFQGVVGYRVAVLFPKDGVSLRQRRQMTTLGGNVIALAVRGSFDDCQRIVKTAFLDPDMSREHALTSANSINVGRLLPQAMYYVYAAAALGWNQPARFTVPSGNLGNLCSGLIAHRAGMPAAGFVAATNANRGFVDFLESGSFEPRRSIATTSNAMDVGDPSNLERIRWLYRDDPTRLVSDVTGECVSDDEVARCIAEVYGTTGYVLDPHSAVAFEAARRHHTPNRPSVVLATAHPAKFPEVVEAAIGRRLALPEGLARGMDSEEHMTEISPDVRSLNAALSAEAS